MSKSERIRQLELAVQRLEMHVELMAMTISNLLESQEMSVSNDLDSGKWYKKITETP
jgi:hypothetical protein